MASFTFAPNFSFAPTAAHADAHSRLQFDNLSEDYPLSSLGGWLVADLKRGQTCDYSIFFLVKIIGMLSLCAHVFPLWNDLWPEPGALLTSVLHCKTTAANVTE